MKDENLFIQKNVFDNNDQWSLQNINLHSKLSANINKLILNNFDDLIYLLYKVDVSEKKLKTLLKENTNADAGSVIATLIIERLLQKIKSRSEFKRDDNIREDESW